MDALTERARPRWGRLLKRILVIALGATTAGVALMLIVSADARYIARAGIEEARLLLRRHAIDRMVGNARAMGANAVVMMRFDSSEMGQTMTEVVAYGTAAVIERSA